MKNIMHLGSISELAHKLCDLTKQVQSYYKTLLQKITTIGASTEDATSNIELLQTYIDGKQDALTAGDGITLSGNTISTYVTDSMKEYGYSLLPGGIFVHLSFVTSSSRVSGYGVDGTLTCANASNLNSASYRVEGYFYDSTGTFIQHTSQEVVLPANTVSVSFTVAAPTANTAWGYSKVIVGSNLGGVTQVYATLQGVNYELHK